MYEYTNTYTTTDNESGTVDYFFSHLVINSDIVLHSLVINTDPNVLSWIIFTVIKLDLWLLVILHVHSLYQECHMGLFCDLCFS